MSLRALRTPNEARPRLRRTTRLSGRPAAPQVLLPGCIVLCRTSAGRRLPGRAPLLAAEVRSPEDYGRRPERAMAAKRADYFAAGTQVVLDVEVLREGWIKVYRAGAPDAPTVFRRGEIVTVEPEMPGWTFPVDDLFE